MIGFVGLSHLGLNYGLATAAHGFDVVAHDPDEALVARCAAGDFPIDEPGFADLHAAHRSRVTYTADAGRLAACELVFFALDIATDERNESDVGPLTALLHRTLPALAPDATVVVLSQVAPGFTRGFVASLPAEARARRRFFYQVETLVFGAAVSRAMQPERYIVGAEEPAAPVAPPLAAWHAAFGCPVLVMRYESAELAKIAINFFLVSSVSTTNTLAEVCEAIGADWEEIAPALRLDRRIGPHAYLKPGLGLAGGNLERDLATVRRLAALHGTDDRVVAAWQANSAHRRDWALRRLHADLLARTRDPLVAVWGLAYKQDTHSTKNSPSIGLLSALPGVRFAAHDPVARLPAEGCGHVRVAADPLAVLEGADALVVMTPWPLYGRVPAAEIARRLRGRLVLDPYAALDARACRAAGIDHRRLGC